MEKEFEHDLHTSEPTPDTVSIPTPDYEPEEFIPVPPDPIPDTAPDDIPEPTSEDTESRIDDGAIMPKADPTPDDIPEPPPNKKTTNRKVVEPKDKELIEDEDEIEEDDSKAIDDFSTPKRRAIYVDDEDEEEEEPEDTETKEEPKKEPEPQTKVPPNPFTGTIYEKSQRDATAAEWKPEAKMITFFFERFEARVFGMISKKKYDDFKLTKEEREYFESTVAECLEKYMPRIMKGGKGDPIDRLWVLIALIVLHRVMLAFEDEIMGFLIPKPKEVPKPPAAEKETTQSKAGSTQKKATSETQSKAGSNTKGKGGTRNTNKAA